MNLTPTTTRRRLLAHAPAVAAMALPTAAIAAPGLATAIPGHLDVQGVKGLAEALERLDKLPTDLARQVLTAITQSLECSMDGHAHDAELIALGPKLDEAFAESRSDEDHSADNLFVLIDRIMGYKPLTREGLKLQCKALVMDGADDWDWRVTSFVANFVRYFGMTEELPDELTVDLFTRAWPEENDDEGDENEA